MDGKNPKEKLVSSIELTPLFIPETSSQLALYGKLSWYLRAARLGLPVSNRAMLLLDCTNDANKAMFNSDEIYLCRPDAPAGLWNTLPRWRDLTGKEIFTFLTELQKKVSEAVLLVFPHPTLEVLNEYRPRYKTDGAFTISLDVTGSHKIRHMSFYLCVFFCIMDTM